MYRNRCSFESWGIGRSHLSWNCWEGKSHKRSHKRSLQDFNFTAQIHALIPPIQYKLNEYKYATHNYSLGRSKFINCMAMSSFILRNIIISIIFAQSWKPSCSLSLQPFQSLSRYDRSSLYELKKQLANLQDSFAARNDSLSIHSSGNRNLPRITTFLWRPKDCSPMVSVLWTFHCTIITKNVLRASLSVEHFATIKLKLVLVYVPHTLFCWFGSFQRVLMPNSLVIGTGFCRIFEIEGVERSLYGYLMFTHCGVIHTLWWNAKSDWEAKFKNKMAFSCEKSWPRRYKVENSASDRAAWMSYQSVAENLQVDPSTVWNSALLTCWLRSTTLWLTTDNLIRNAQRKTLFVDIAKILQNPVVKLLSHSKMWSTPSDYHRSHITH